ncbi:uncharacterized protein VDAG_03515 [Verticillium dahliae VdLs.17]|uniref:Heterokaryon incompatibility domain-containing protein n=1 Tax=Verticillium dahliae (strain VdLs.17 / ATCC MYA-4575 / FGSC 10137) TaxID=498257 RepID=G2WZS3_VERDV|nr:uncharacterized protein VDAG_03515 [Verticillium dahliae VdLs.17]EGY22075.1 hypothetical protein VDAG_03515 [Verticillium dahliae VdLs.17]KAF3346565.1 hypothetical protein VdG2_05225 [Verticillium dahliae VDG2]KAH6703919.1 hypothetical protein EV126DRAFT_382144 [Verticillium dahliae]
MDHLPVPSDRCLVDHIRIPYLATDKYDAPFSSYPHRSGWNLKLGSELAREIAFAPESQAARYIGSLAQTWLYFGLLAQFLGEPVNQETFRLMDNVEDGPARLCTQPLEQLVCARTQTLLDHFNVNGSREIESFRDEFQDVLIMVRHQTLLLLPKEADQDSAVAMTCLAIAALADYLSTALLGLCQRTGLDSPVTQVWRLLNTGFQFDCGLPLLQLMSEQGWCPSILTDVSYDPQVDTVSVLWYIGNLLPPNNDIPHAVCTPIACALHHVDETQYAQVHAFEDCRCDAVGPGLSELETIIRNGKIPVMKLEGNMLSVREAETGSAFVAISHVWADGMGNPAANTLPLCRILEIQRLVNELPKRNRDNQDNTPFWIDTLCVPRGPRDLRRIALGQLRKPYEQAADVLVLDSYLRRQISEGRTTSELLAVIALCPWSHRLWTFQEGRIPRQPAYVWFSFQDAVIDLSSRLRTPEPNFPTRAARTVSLRLLLGHQQTRASAGLLPDEHLHHPSVLRQVLAGRRTSRSEDEALCISSLLNLAPDVADKIICSAGEARMAAIWDHLPTIPVGIAFSKSTKKLNISGFRWAPSTFMGDSDTSLKHWEGPNGTWAAPPAQATPTGLAIHRPAMLLDDFCSGALSEGDHELSSDLVMRRQIGDAVVDFLGDHPSVLDLMKGINVHGQWGEDDDLAIRDCIGLVEAFVEYGDFLAVNTTQTDRIWCLG